MPRAQNTDLYHVFKFNIIDSKDLLGGSSAGFKTVTLPEMNLETVEYKEGIWTYRRKFPGDVTFGNVTLSKGVVKTNTKFYDWIKKCAEGLEYRLDLEIYHFHRDDVKGMSNYLTAKPSRIIKLMDAFPVRVKPGSDFDSQTSDVSVEEIEIAIEQFTITAT